MSVPGYQEFMYPFLVVLSDGEEHTLQEMYESLADYFKLTESEITEKLPSGQQTLLVNRIGWTRTYLNKAGLIRVVRRAVFQITDEGLQLINDPAITRLDKKFLMRYPSFKSFANTPKQNEETRTDRNEEKTPYELIAENHQILKETLQNQMLEKILLCSPHFFEQLIVDLVVAMGYGGSVKDAGQAIGKSGDEGIDGIIKEDVLGLDMIFLQAKRWRLESTVSRPDIQGFVGSLVGKKASKGIFITTSKFSKEAMEYARGIDKRVILIDGHKLTDLMFTYNVGVSHEAEYVIKKLDLDYFEEASL